MITKQELNDYKRRIELIMNDPEIMKRSEYAGESVTCNRFELTEMRT